MAIHPKVHMSPETLDEIMHSERHLRLSTLSPSGRMNLVPLVFGWTEGKVYIWCRGKKIDNLRRDSRATILVDRGDEYPRLQGVMMQGTCQLLEDAAAEVADPHLALARRDMERKYAGTFDQTAKAPNWRWVAFTPTHTVTWDNTKLNLRTQSAG